MSEFENIASEPEPAPAPPPQAPVPVDVVNFDGRAADLPEALHQIAEVLSRSAGILIAADRLKCIVSVVEGATTYTTFRIEAWRSRS